jgi:hypothetical protein
LTQVCYLIEKNVEIRAYNILNSCTSKSVLSNLAAIRYMWRQAI